MKHDDIVLSLDDKKIAKLILNSKVLGEQIDLENVFTDETKTRIKNSILIKHFKYLIENNRLTIENHEFIIKCLNGLINYKKEYIRNEYDTLIIHKTFEFPIIKGRGEYKITKGFIDLIVQCRSASCGCASLYQIQKAEFIIEIKTEKDFNDFGSILRQIKEYKEYYNDNSIKKWQRTIDFDKPERFYCILSTKIPEEVKKLFRSEGILCLELDSLNQKTLE